MTEAIEAAKRILAAVRKREDKNSTWYELTGMGFIGLESPYEVATELLRLADSAKPGNAAVSPQLIEELKRSMKSYEGGSCVLLPDGCAVWQAEPQWGEPKEIGPVWVEGEDGVWACRRNRDDGQWWVAYCIGEDGMKSIKANWEPLNGRRVAPCVGRPGKVGG